MDERWKNVEGRPLGVAPDHAAGTIRTPDGVVLAQVNGTAMSDDLRNRVAKQLVEGWNKLLDEPVLPSHPAV